MNRRFINLQSYVINDDIMHQRMLLLIMSHYDYRHNTNIYHQLE
jgi:hypothetical protein